MESRLRKRMLIVIAGAVAVVVVAAAVLYQPAYRYYRKGISDCNQWSVSWNLSSSHLIQLERSSAMLMRRLYANAGRRFHLPQRNINRAARVLAQVRRAQREDAATVRRGLQPDPCGTGRLPTSLHDAAMRLRDLTVRSEQRIALLNNDFRLIRETVLNSDAVAVHALRRQLRAVMHGMQGLLNDAQGKVANAAALANLRNALMRADSMLRGAPSYSECKGAETLLYNAADGVVRSRNVKSGINCAVQRCVALTFDDGPSYTVTSRMLRALDQAGAHASFFQIAQKVSPADRPLLQRMKAQGSTVGNHTWSHKSLPDIVARHLESRELKKSAATIEAAGASPINLIRPPYGAVNDASREYVAQTLGLGIAMYGDDSYDWANGADASTVKEKVMAQVEPGSIVLMHDVYGHSADALPQIISTLRGEGYTFVTIEELTGEYPRAGAVYYSRTNILRM